MLSEHPINTRGPLYVYPGGIVKRTTFHTMAMYANLLESRVAQTEVQAGPLVSGDQSVALLDAIATVDEAQTMCSVALVNRHPSKEVKCTIDLKGASLPSAPLEAAVLVGDSPEAYNDIEHPNRVVPENKQLLLNKGAVKLEPHSLTIVKIPVN
jgi:alpha-N-arabinofuranosidase